MTIMHDDLISIIVPVYNQEQTILECIQSICDQTYPNIEIIVVDDGSTDNTPEILRHAQDKDNRILVITQKNSGPGAARNTGIRAANGVYLSFVDSDDRMQKDMIEVMHRKMHETKSEVCICGFYIVIDGQIQEKVYEQEKEYSVSEYTNLICKWKDHPFVGAVWNKMISSELVKKNGVVFSEDQTWGEDYSFNMDLLLFADRVTIIDDCLYYHISNNNSISYQNLLIYRNNISGFWNIKLEAYKKTENLFKEKASTDNCLIIQSLCLTYAFNIIGYSCNNVKLRSTIENIKMIKESVNLEYDRIIASKEFFPKEIRIKAGILKYMNSFWLAIAESVLCGIKKPQHGK